MGLGEDLLTTSVNASSNGTAAAWWQFVLVFGVIAIGIAVAVVTVVKTWPRAREHPVISTGVAFVVVVVLSIAGSAYGSAVDSTNSLAAGWPVAVVAGFAFVAWVMFGVYGVLAVITFWHRARRRQGKRRAWVVDRPLQRPATGVRPIDPAPLPVRSERSRVRLTTWLLGFWQVGTVALVLGAALLPESPGFHGSRGGTVGGLLVLSVAVDMALLVVRALGGRIAAHRRR